MSVRPIDANALMDFARNHVNRTVDCNDIARFPTIDYVPRQQWISVKDRLPEPEADGSIPAVLVTDGKFIHMAYCSNNNWFFCETGEMKEDMFYFVSHWMPLPEPPKEDSK